MDTKKLRQKILDLAIRGKLVPQDSNDEPASVLLERIKAEKERLIKEGKIKRSKKSAKTSDTPHYENVPFEVPESWMWCKLDDLAFYKKGPFGSSLTKAMFVPKGKDTYKVYEQKNAIQKDHKLGSYYISTEKYCSLSGFAVHPNDIIVSCAGTIGETYVLPQNIQEGIINQALMLIRLYNPEIEGFYLLYFDFILKQEAYKESKGTAIKNIPPFDVLKNFFIPIPPKEEQKRILSEVDKWMSFVDGIDTNCKDLQLYIKHTKSKILDLAIHGKLVPQDPNDEPAIELLKRINPDFTPCDNGHSEKFPQDWEHILIGDYVEAVTDFVASGSFASLRENVKYYNEPNYAILVRTKDFQNNFKQDLVYTDQHGYDFLAKSNLFGGELIFSNVGSIGKIFIVPELNQKMTLAPNAIMVRFHNDKQQKWFYYLFSSATGQSLLDSITSATAIGKFNKTDFKKLPIPIPPLAEQQRIVQKIEELFHVLDNIQNALEV